MAALERVRLMLGIGSLEEYSERLGYGSGTYWEWKSGRRETIPAQALIAAFELAAGVPTPRGQPWTPDRLLAESAWEWFDPLFRSTD